MQGSLQDKKIFLIFLALATFLGYSIVFLIAFLKYKGDDKLAFIKREGKDLSMIILISIPGSFFGSLFLWGGVYIVLDSIFKISFSYNQRFSLLVICYAIIFIGCLIYAYKQIVMEAGPRDPGPVK